MFKQYLLIFANIRSNFNVRLWFGLMRVFHKDLDSDNVRFCFYLFQVLFSEKVAKLFSLAFKPLFLTNKRLHTKVFCSLKIMLMKFIQIEGPSLNFVSILI